MHPSVFARHLPLPAAVERGTGAILILKDALAQNATLADLSSLPVDKKAELIKARWLAGGWSDLIYGAAGLIDRDRAIRELDGRTPIGLDLLAVEMEALRMLHEDAAGHGGIS